MRTQVPPFPQLEAGDVFDLLTPLVLVPLWGTLFLAAAPGRPRMRTTLIFLALAALWTLGQGIHLVGNSMSHLTSAYPDTDVHKLAYFFDEKLGHVLWHTGMFSLTTLILAREAIHLEPVGPEAAAAADAERASWPWFKRIRGVESLAAAIYGFTLFIIVVEGQTGWFGVPFAIAVVLFAWNEHRRGRDRGVDRQMLRFFGLGHAVALILFAIWFALWRGLPEFSAVGFID